MFESFEKLEQLRQPFKAAPRTAFVIALVWAFLLGGFCVEFAAFLVREHAPHHPSTIVKMGLWLALAALFLFLNAGVVWRFLPRKRDEENLTDTALPRSGDVR